MVRPRERRCKQSSGMTGQFYCWGFLIAAPKTKPAPAAGKLEAKLVLAHSNLDAHMRQLKRTVTAISAWQMKIKRLERRIEERDHPTEKQPKPRKRTRAIELPPDDGTEATIPT